MEQSIVSPQEEVTLADILSAINGFATATEERFTKIEAKMVTKEELRQELGKLSVKMVTKDYLDDKLSKLKGDLTSLTRQEDRKLTALVKLLSEHKIINNQDAWSILVMEPFNHSSGNS